MKKNNGNSPSAYQTISQFCEESNFDNIDNDTPNVRPARSPMAIVKLLATSAWRRRQAGTAD